MSAVRQGGTLYGIGAGPGDPGLVTRKAWARVQNTSVIAYPAAEGHGSFVRAIMADAIADDAVEIKIAIPMTNTRKPAQDAYAKGAAAIESYLKKGNDVCLLCEGDPLFYGSFMYMLAILRDRYCVKIIPGVTSMTACAATHNIALGARRDTISVIPAGVDDDALRKRIILADTAVLIKLGRHMPRIRALLTEMGYADTALYTSHASLPQQRACALKDAPDDAPYFSMIILYKGDDT